eukprot:9352705-Heterocapsa_arctica.AAC.1
MLFIAPFIQPLSRHAACRCYVTDFCQFGVDLPLGTVSLGAPASSSVRAAAVLAQKPANSTSFSAEPT